MHNILQMDDVLVSQLLQECDLTDGCTWDALICMFKSDLFKGDNLLERGLSI